MNRCAGVVAIAGVLLAGMAAAAAEPADAVKVVKTVWKKPGRNNIGIADITLANDNPFAVKNIKIKCVFTTAATGKVTEIDQVVAGPVKAKAEQTFKKVSFGFVDTQAAEGACRVLGATQI
jgi:hypothetical protein